MVRQRWSTPFFGQHIFSLESAHKQQKKRDIRSVTLTVIFSSSSNFACTLSGASSRIPLASRTITRNSCAVFVVVACIVRSSSSSSSSRIVVLNVFLNFRAEKKMEILSSTEHTKKKRWTREKRFRSITRTTTTSLAAATAETASLLSLSYIYIYVYIDNSLLPLFSSENFLYVWNAQRKKSSKIFLFLNFFLKSLFFFISVKHTNPY